MTGGGNMRPLRFTHFGAAGWKITDGETVILLDPYLSRVRFQGRRYGPHDATAMCPRPISSSCPIPISTTPWTCPISPTRRVLW